MNNIRLHVLAISLLGCLSLIACDDKEEDTGAPPDDTGATGDDTDATGDDTGCPTWYADADGDGYGSPDYTVEDCGTPEGYVSNADDCDDTDSASHPGADELCDELDQDCDDVVDEDTTGSVWYADIDGDGFGDPDNASESCDVLSDHVADSSDCDDGDASVNPDASEVCLDGVDNDCDGLAEGCQMSGINNLSGAWKIEGTSASEYAGGEVSAAGDVNGDGHEDLLIADSYYKDGTYNEYFGAVWVLHGPFTGDVQLSDAAALLIGDNNESYAGRTLDAAGDVNGDGYDDFIVGSPYNNPSPEYYLGAAWVVYGPVSGEHTLSDIAPRLDSEYYDFVESVAGPGDLNGDGFNDLLIGAPGSDDGGSNAGAAYIVYGPVDSDIELTDQADVTLAGSSDGDDVGTTVSALGDVNGDGTPDFLAAGFDNGEAWFFSGPTRTSSVNGADAAWSGFDYVTGAAGVGDIDGDGYNDMALGNRNYEPGGAWWVYLGPPSSSESPSSAYVRLEATGTDDYVGWYADGVGDMDGDGRDEFMVSAPYGDSGNSDAGTTYLLYGSELSSGTMSLGDAQAFFPGERADDHAGTNVAGPGDVTGDGVPDLLIGSWANAAYLVEGESF